MIYSLNINTYDKGYKPYYPSMDPNAMGGELKSKKKQKTERRNNDLGIEPKDKSKNNSLLKLSEAYNDTD